MNARKNRRATSVSAIERTPLGIEIYQPTRLDAVCKYTVGSVIAAGAAFAAVNLSATPASAGDFDTYFGGGGGDLFSSTPTFADFNPTPTVSAPAPTVVYTPPPVTVEAVPPSAAPTEAAPLPTSPPASVTATTAEPSAQDVAMVAVIDQAAQDAASVVAIDQAVGPLPASEVLLDVAPVVEAPAVNQAPVVQAPVDQAPVDQPVDQVVAAEPSAQDAAMVAVIDQAAQDAASARAIDQAVGPLPASEVLLDVAPVPQEQLVQVETPAGDADAALVAVIDEEAGFEQPVVVSQPPAVGEVVVASLAGGDPEVDSVFPKVAVAPLFDGGAVPEPGAEAASSQGELIELVVPSGEDAVALTAIDRALKTALPAVDASDGSAAGLGRVSSTDSLRNVLNAGTPDPSTGLVEQTPAVPPQVPENSTASGLIVGVNTTRAGEGANVAVSTTVKNINGSGVDANLTPYLAVAPNSQVIPGAAVSVTLPTGTTVGGNFSTVSDTEFVSQKLGSGSGSLGVANNAANQLLVNGTVPLASNLNLSGEYNTATGDVGATLSDSRFALGANTNGTFTGSAKLTNELSATAFTGPGGTGGSLQYAIPLGGGAAAPAGTPASNLGLTDPGSTGEPNEPVFATDLLGLRSGLITDDPSFPSIAGAATPTGATTFGAPTVVTGPQPAAPLTSTATGSAFELLPEGTTLNTTDATQFSTGSALPAEVLASTQPDAFDIASTFPAQAGTQDGEPIGALTIAELPDTLTPEETTTPATGFALTSPTNPEASSAVTSPATDQVLGYTNPNVTVGTIEGIPLDPDGAPFDLPNGVTSPFADPTALQFGDLSATTGGNTAADFTAPTTASFYPQVSDLQASDQLNSDLQASNLQEIAVGELDTAPLPAALFPTGPRPIDGTDPDPTNSTNTEVLVAATGLEGLGLKFGDPATSELLAQATPTPQTPTDPRQQTIDRFGSPITVDDVGVISVGGAFPPTQATQTGAFNDAWVIDGQRNPDAVEYWSFPDQVAQSTGTLTPVEPATGVEPPGIKWGSIATYAGVGILPSARGTFIVNTNAGRSPAEALTNVAIRVPFGVFNDVGTRAALADGGPITLSDDPTANGIYKAGLGGLASAALDWGVVKKIVNPIATSILKRPIDASAGLNPGTLIVLPVVEKIAQNAFGSAEDALGGCRSGSTDPLEYLCNKAVSSAVTVGTVSTSVGVDQMLKEVKRLKQSNIDCGCSADGALTPEQDAQVMANFVDTVLNVGVAVTAQSGVTAAVDYPGKIDWPLPEENCPTADGSYANCFPAIGGIRPMQPPAAGGGAAGWNSQRDLIPIPVNTACGCRANYEADEKPVDPITFSTQVAPKTPVIFDDTFGKAPVWQPDPTAKKTSDAPAALPTPNISWSRTSTPVKPVGQKNDNLFGYEMPTTSQPAKVAPAAKAPAPVAPVWSNVRIDQNAKLNLPTRSWSGVPEVQPSAVAPVAATQPAPVVKLKPTPENLGAAPRDPATNALLDGAEWVFKNGLWVVVKTGEIGGKVISPLFGEWLQQP